MPIDLTMQASVLGMQDIRAIGGVPSEYLIQDIVQLMEQEEQQHDSWFFNSDRTYEMLAISGGGDKGAYGAGLLNGWTQAGTRPSFKIVTGISTGAIIAPFAFVGSVYDMRLREFYTKYSTKDIIKKRFLRNALATANPFKDLIEQNIDDDLIKKVALEYRKGRRLYIGTTNLDIQRLVIWDMGKIASLETPQAMDLFRKIILASASIPVVFPPVILKVQAGDKSYDEMHVDGGVTKQVFFIHEIVQGVEIAAKKKGVDTSKLHYKIYVIQNGFVSPVWKEVPNKLSAIAVRTMDTMTGAQSVGDIYQLYVFTQRTHGDFNLAYIPESHLPEGRELFDPIAMKALFEIGFNQAVQGYVWRKTPPGLED